MAPTDALIFDAIRTPRGKGKPNGSLHTTKPIDLVIGLIGMRSDDLEFAVTTPAIAG